MNRRDGLRLLACAATLLSKMTTIGAIVFMLTSFALSMMASSGSGKSGSVLDEVPAPKGVPLGAVGTLRSASRGSCRADRPAARSATRTGPSAPTAAPGSALQRAESREHLGQSLPAAPGRVLERGGVDHPPR